MRILSLQVPCDKLVPWSAPNNNITYISFLLKILLVFSNVIDFKGKFVEAEVCGILVTGTILLTYKFMYSPIFNTIVDFIDKVTHALVLLMLFLGVLCLIIGNA